MVKLQRVARPSRYTFSAASRSGKQFDIIAFETVTNFNIKDIKMDVFSNAWIAAGFDPKYVGGVTKKGIASRTVDATTAQLSNQNHKTMKVGTDKSGVVIYKIFKGDTFINISDQLDAVMNPYAYIECNLATCDIKTDNNLVNDMLNENFKYFTTHYTNADITRYLKTMLENETTLVSLRKNGGVYIIPAKDHAIVQKLRNLFDAIDPDGDFHVTELPDLEGAKEAIATSYQREMKEVCDKMKSDIEKFKTDGKDMSPTVRKNLFNEIISHSKELEMMTDITEYDLTESKDQLNEVNQMIATFVQTGEV